MLPIRFRAAVTVSVVIVAIPLPIPSMPLRNFSASNVKIPVRMSARPPPACERPLIGSRKSLARSPAIGMSFTSSSELVIAVGKTVPSRSEVA